MSQEVEAIVGATLTGDQKHDGDVRSCAARATRRALPRVSTRSRGRSRGRSDPRAPARHRSRSSALRASTPIDVHGEGHVLRLPVCERASPRGIMRVTTSSCYAGVTEFVTPSCMVTLRKSKRKGKFDGCLRRRRNQAGPCAPRRRDGPSWPPSTFSGVVGPCASCGSSRPSRSAPALSCRAARGLSPSVLYDRLRELTEAGLIGREGQDYALTNLGRALGDAIAPLDAWAKRWAKEVG